MATNCSGVSCNFGRAGCELASCTILGSAGKILGGSCGACRLNQRLPWMRRVQRLGDDRLPRMKRVGAATGRSLRSAIPWRGLRRLCCGQDGRKILHRAVPRQFHFRRRSYNARRANVPDRRRKQNQKDLQSNGGRKRKLRKSLLDPAIAKVRITKKFLRGDRSANQDHPTGSKLFQPACLLQGQTRGARRFSANRTPRANDPSNAGHPCRAVATYFGIITPPASLPAV